MEDTTKKELLDYLNKDLVKVKRQMGLTSGMIEEAAEVYDQEDFYIDELMNLYSNLENRANMLEKFIKTLNEQGGVLS